MTFHVEEWRPSPDPVPIVRRQSTRALPAPLIGIIATLLLHSSIMFFVLVDGKAAPEKEQPIDSAGIGDAQNTSRSKAAETLVLLTLDKDPGRKKKIVSDNLTSAGISAIFTPLEVAAATAPALVTIAHDEQVEQAGVELSADGIDMAERAAMFGRYTGQINARIERMWQRPRSPIDGTTHSQAAASSVADDEAFKCVAEVIQDQAGYVQEINLLICNGSPDWRQSLVKAILASSPLPAPPTPAVYTRSITLTFLGFSYRKGADEDEYVADVPLRVAHSD